MIGELDSRCLRRKGLTSKAAALLTAKGFHLFLPKIDAWSQRVGERHLIAVPMFPGYLFLRHALEKTSYLEVREARGLVRILGDRGDHLSAIPDVEIAAIHTTIHRTSSTGAWIPRGPSWSNGEILGGKALRTSWPDKVLSSRIARNGLMKLCFLKWQDARHVPTFRRC